MFSKYYERGLAVMPILPHSKAPVGEATDYPRWAKERQDPELIEKWDEKYSIRDGYGVAVILGAISNLDSVDIDTLRQDIISECPVSPVVRRGNPKRFGAGIFRHNPHLGFSYKPFATHETNLDTGEITKHGVDILSAGRYLILPPSINKDSKTPYVWLTPDTLDNFDACDLPMLLPEHISNIEKVFLHLNNDNFAGTSEISGRNDYLKSIVWAKRMNCESEEDIVEAVYQIDLCKNSPPLFSDPTEGFKADGQLGARMNAWKFVNRVTKSFIDRKAGPVPRIKLPEISMSGEKKIAIKWIQKPFPEPNGLVKDVRDLILKSSKYAQPGLAMAGAISICSVLIANKFKMGNTWPNIYILGIAPTGSGKQFPINAAVKLLIEDHETNLYGKDIVLSGQAFVKGLDIQRERLDVIDECHAFFSMISKGGIFQNDILPIMLKLYSASSSIFISPGTKERDGVRVFHPSVSALMLTNFDDFRLSVTRNFVTGGFLPRCLTFIEESRGDRNASFSDDSSWDEDLLAKIGSKIKSLMAIKIVTDSSNMVSNKPIPKDVFISQEAKNIFKALDEEIDEITKGNISEIKRHIVTRLVQNARKLALIHGVLKEGVVDGLDALWAVEMMKAMAYNCEPTFEKIMATTPSEAATLGVIDIIKRHGKIREGEFFVLTRALTKSQRLEAVDAARIEGKIRVCVDESGKVYESI